MSPVFWFLGKSYRHLLVVSSHWAHDVVVTVATGSCAQWVHIYAKNSRKRRSNMTTAFRFIVYSYCQLVSRLIDKNKAIIKKEIISTDVPVLVCTHDCLGSSPWCDNVFILHLVSLTEVAHSYCFVVVYLLNDITLC